MRPNPAGRALFIDLDSLEGDEPDLVTDGEIDLGELAAETLVLAIDPYPRKPGAVLPAICPKGRPSPVKRRKIPSGRWRN